MGRIFEAIAYALMAIITLLILAIFYIAYDFHYGGAALSNGGNGATMPIPLIGLLLLIISIGLYFLPSIVAKQRNHHNATSIILLNIFLGWTLLGWVIALVWSASALRKNVEIDI